MKFQVEPDSLRNVGSHSCKTTLSGVAAKGGVSRVSRLTLGGHATPGDSSEDCYSRDAIASPLLELAQLLADIREGRFDPDASRSGRWQPSTIIVLAHGRKACKTCRGPVAGSKVSACDCGAFVHISPDCCRQCDLCAAEFYPVVRRL